MKQVYLRSNSNTMTTRILMILSIMAVGVLSSIIIANLICTTPGFWGTTNGMLVITNALGISAAISLIVDVLVFFKEENGEQQDSPTEPVVNTGEVGDNPLVKVNQTKEFSNNQ